ncbi:hypothetical protein, partial [Microvirga aerophila]|uniref:hypothetical protein n=1 Tax=Microvirga aerophila TaxID=670291 RepID=UPI001AECC30B
GSAKPLSAQPWLNTYNPDGEDDHEFEHHPSNDKSDDDLPETIRDEPVQDRHESDESDNCNEYGTYRQFVAHVRFPSDQPGRSRASHSDQQKTKRLLLYSAIISHERFIIRSNPTPLQGLSVVLVGDPLSGFLLLMPDV